MQILKTVLFLGIVVFTLPTLAKSVHADTDLKGTFDVDSTDYNGEIDIDSVEVVSNGSLVFDSVHVIPNHSLYHIWLNNLINPYNVDLTQKTDTTFINCKGYYSPIVNHVNSDFGFRHWKFHYGIDLHLTVGDSVHSAFDGMVRMATRGKRFGYYVVIRHYNGLETVYGHLKKILVQPNQIVKAGDIIALGGNTGHSTGPHLHLEFRYLGLAINPHDVVNFSKDNQPLLNDTLRLCKNTYDYVLEIRKIRYHIVKKGETLSHIAHQYGVSVNQIYKLNNMSAKKHLIRPKQRIRYT